MLISRSKKRNSGFLIDSAVRFSVVSRSGRSVSHRLHWARRMRIQAGPVDASAAWRGSIFRAPASSSSVVCISKRGE